MKNSNKRGAMGGHNSQRITSLSLKSGDKMSAKGGQAIKALSIHKKGMNVQTKSKAKPNKTKL